GRRLVDWREFLRHCERSEAIHVSEQRRMDCFVALLLAMTVVCVLRRQYYGMLSSCLPTTIQCTSSGPSAKRRCRTSWYISPSGLHCEMPVAPCIWIAWSMILQVRSGTMAFTMLTQIRASLLPSTSIAFAA